MMLVNAIAKLDFRVGIVAIPATTRLLARGRSNALAVRMRLLKRTLLIEDPMAEEARAVQDVVGIDDLRVAKPTAVPTLVRQWRLSYDQHYHDLAAPAVGIGDGGRSFSTTGLTRSKSGCMSGYVSSSGDD
jgi:hypothetical protein